MTPDETGATTLILWSSMEEKIVNEDGRCAVEYGGKALVEVFSSTMRNGRD